MLILPTTYTVHFAIQVSYLEIEESKFYRTLCLFTKTTKRMDETTLGAMTLGACQEEHIIG